MKLSWKTLHIPSMLGRPATYQGYYVSFGTICLPEEHHARGYKTPIHQVPSKGKEEDGFGEVLLPFSSFSAKRDEVTRLPFR